MNTDVPNPNNPERPLRVIIHPAQGTVLANAEPDTAAVRVPIARVPVTELLVEPAKESASPIASPTSPATEIDETHGKSAAAKAVAASVETLIELLRITPRAAINVDAAVFPNDPIGIKLRRSRGNEAIVQFAWIVEHHEAAA
jgi:hypothetical protein